MHRPAPSTSIGAERSRLGADWVSSLRRLFSAELPPLAERHRPWLTAYVALHAVGYAVVYVATLHFVFLGPGLPDEVTYRHVLAVLGEALERDLLIGLPLTTGAFVALILITTVARGFIVYRGYTDYPKTLGGPVPLDEALTLILTNGLNIAFAPVVLVLLGLLAPAVGLTAETGRSALAAVIAAAQRVVEQIPTPVTLPRGLAFFCTLMGVTFLHYWLHRLSHSRRLPWLLLHRPHHLTQHLCYGTTLPVFFAFPLFLAIAFPYVFIFGALGKLFFETPLYAEMIVYQALISVGEIYGHSPALYQRGIRQPLVRFMSFINCQGLYHVLHHSALPAIARGGSNNTVNMGSGPFSCWDLLFGTFAPLPPQVPPLGLMGQPRIYRNPLRLLLAGPLQLAYELASNRDVKSWWSILLGPATWAPAHTRDFALPPPPP
jgi:sterol desaturase/sphingolipid hydroxylase (fatty acid hydroxylase superfamily)